MTGGAYGRLPCGALLPAPCKHLVLMHGYSAIRWASAIHCRTVNTGCCLSSRVRARIQILDGRWQQTANNPQPTLGAQLLFDAPVIKHVSSSMRLHCASGASALHHKCHTCAAAAARPRHLRRRHVAAAIAPAAAVVAAAAAEAAEALVPLLPLPGRGAPPVPPVLTC